MDRLPQLQVCDNDLGMNSRNVSGIDIDAGGKSHDVQGRSQPAQAVFA